MTAIAALTVALAVTGLALIFWAWFVWKDAKAAFDRDPATHTASELIQHWRRQRGLAGAVMLAVGLVLVAVVGTCLIALTTWLVLHLIFELL